MIKFLKKLFHKWMGVEEMDPHLDPYLKEEERDIPLYKGHCDGHTRFKKSCNACQEAKI